MKTKDDNIILKKSYDFAVRCVNLYKYLCNEKHDFVIGKQLMRSGTSVGANVKEAIRGASKADFIAKLWIEGLRDTDYLSSQEAESMLCDCQEILKLLTSIVKSSKEKPIINCAL